MNPNRILKVRKSGKHPWEKPYWKVLHALKTVGSAPTDFIACVTGLSREQVNRSLKTLWRSGDVERLSPGTRGRKAVAGNWKTLQP